MRVVVVVVVVGSPCMTMAIIIWLPAAAGLLLLLLLLLLLPLRAIEDRRLPTGIISHLLDHPGRRTSLLPVTVGLLLSFFIVMGCNN